MSMEKSLMALSNKTLVRVKVYSWIDLNVRYSEYIELEFSPLYTLVFTAGSYVDNLEMHNRIIDTDIFKKKKEFDVDFEVRDLSCNTSIFCSKLNKVKLLNYDGLYVNSAVFEFENGGLFEIYAGADEVHVECDKLKIFKMGGKTPLKISEIEL
jgi:hypothetical protein